MPDSMPNKRTAFAAYRRSDYIVSVRGRQVLLRHGERCPAADELLGKRQGSWAFITAWNPAAKKLPGLENARRQNALEEALIALGFVPLPGWGGSGRWYEQSCFVPGIRLALARALGRTFGQHAILFGKRGGKAKVVACED